MNFDRLKDLMEHFVETNNTPGNTMIVYQRDKEIFNYACGYSDLEKKMLMTGNEYFYIYSCSKIITVTAALQLLEQGKFLLTDPLYEYIPEYKNMYIKTSEGEFVKAKKHITIKNLFNMTAGLTYNMQTNAFKKARKITNGRMDTSEVIRCLAEDPLLFEPGERFEYSLCHDVLGGVVSIITGKRFKDYVKENIFEPLEMNSCSYHLTPDIKNKMATQYRFVDDDDAEFDAVKSQLFGHSKNGKFVNVGFENEFIFGNEYDSGGAGIISNISDLAKFAQALANHGTGLNGERILSPYTVDLMKTNSLDEKQIKTFYGNQHKGYGYGLGVRTMVDKALGGGITNFGEFGWSGAAGTSVYIDTELGMSAVYAKHTLNPREDYYQPRVRNTLYSCCKPIQKY